MFISMNKRKVNCLAALSCVLILMACGNEEAVHTSADVSETEQTEQASDTGETGEEAAGMMNGGSFMAPVEMDETLKNQLAEEMLEESEMDTSVIESAPVTKGCSFTLPEAFMESEDIEGMYVTKRYPIDASTIYYVALDRDVALQLMTEDTFKVQAEENFRKEYGEEIEVHIDSFERMQIDGCPAFRILCHYQVGDTKMSQLEYAINADKSYVITYSQTDDYDRMEEYEASAETIHLDF